MFDYTDPAGTLKPASALTNYRRRLHEQVPDARPPGGLGVHAARGVRRGGRGQAAGGHGPLDRLPQDSPGHQRADRRGTALVPGRVRGVARRAECGRRASRRSPSRPSSSSTYEALAMASHTALVNGIKAVIPGAAPTAPELYGPGFTPAGAAPEARARNSATSPAGTRGTTDARASSAWVRSSTRSAHCSTSPAPSAEPPGAPGRIDLRVARQPLRPGAQFRSLISAAVQTLAAPRAASRSPTRSASSSRTSGASGDRRQ